MSRRALIAISAGAALAVIAISVGVYVVLSDERVPPGTGDFIAYSCKERKNVWYAVCVMKVDGSEKRRLTDRLTTTDPRGLRTVVRSPSRATRTSVNPRRSPTTTCS